jgi:DNA-binding response OmpR family regulator
MIKPRGAIQFACPCCGRKLEEDSSLRWDKDSKTVSRHGKALRLSRYRSIMFDYLWNARGKHVISVEQMMDRVYADHEDGGPESDNTMRVQVCHLKRQLKQLGLTISGRSGYSIIDLESDNRTFMSASENAA